MKSPLRYAGAAALLLLTPLTARLGQAQTAVETITTAPTTTAAATTSVGTISEFSPDTIMIRSESAPQPVAYRYTKTTTYVDETGAPVSMETVKSGLPVTVYYSNGADGMVASKVVVSRATAPAAVEETTTTTTTTTEQ